MGATNRPQDLDDAALRRMVKRVYVPLPDSKTRAQILQKLLDRHGSPLNTEEIVSLARYVVAHCSLSTTVNPWNLNQEP